MLVSVIIPYFKKKKYISSAIKSVLNQSYENFEIIIIYDDEHKDDLKLINNLKKLDKRIKVIHNKKNLGAGISRNKGIKLSKGKYIAFLDSDDLWKRNKLSVQIKFMKNANAHISHCSYNIINNAGKKISSRYARDLSYKDLLQSCDVGLSTVLLEKKILNFKNPFPNLKTKEDYVLWLKLAKKGFKFKALKKKLAIWRSLDNSLSNSSTQKIMDAIKVYYCYEKMNIFKSIYHTVSLSINYLLKR